MQTWDVAAGSLLCSCAGLEVRALPARRGAPQGLVVAPPGLIEALTGLVA